MTAGAVVALTAAPAAAHPLHATSGPFSWPDVLGRSALGTALLWATLPLAGLLLASLWAQREQGSRFWETVLGVVLVVTVALIRDKGLDALAFGLIVGHLLAAAVWLGGLLDLIVRREDRWAAARRFGPFGIGAVVVLVVTGIWNVRVHTGGLTLAGDYEHVLALKLSLVVGTLAVAAIAHRRVRRHAAPSRRLISGEAGLLATVVAAAAVLTALPAAAAAAPKVSLSRAANRITVRSGGDSYTASGPDAEECASHLVGVVLGGGDPRRLPCSSAEPAAPLYGSAFARFLAEKRVTSAVVVSDNSSRSQLMTDAFVSEARARSVEVDVVHSASQVRSWGDAAVITAGWSTAQDALAGIATTNAPPVRGAFLAPWLLSSTVSGGPGRVQFSVGLPFDPSESSVGVYLTQVATRARGATPSTAGLEGWLAAKSVRQQGPSAIQFFTPAQIDILPLSVDAGHDHGGTDWVSGGQMAAVSGLVRLDD